MFGDADRRGRRVAYKNVESLVRPNVHYASGYHTEPGPNGLFIRGDDHETRNITGYEDWFFSPWGYGSSFSNANAFVAVTLGAGEIIGRCYKLRLWSVRWAWGLVVVYGHDHVGLIYRQDLDGRGVPWDYFPFWREDALDKAAYKRRAQEDSCTE